MEKENKKRGREGEEITIKDSPSTEKKHHLNVEIGNMSIEESDHHDDNYNMQMGLGVFDFPWLKESMISKSEEEWCLFEDSFAFSLNNTCSADAESESSWHCLSETAETFMESIDIPLDKFEETVWSLEMEGVDCNWASTLSQPLA